MKYEKPAVFIVLTDEEDIVRTSWLEDVGTEDEKDKIEF